MIAQVVFGTISYVLIVFALFFQVVLTWASTDGVTMQKEAFLMLFSLYVGAFVTNFFARSFKS